jgi:hypothetical protein
MYVYTYIHHVCKYILRPNSIHPLFLPCKEMRNLHKTVVYIASDAIQGSLCNASKNYNFYLIKKNYFYNNKNITSFYMGIFIIIFIFTSFYRENKKVKFKTPL